MISNSPYVKTVIMSPTSFAGVGDQSLYTMPPNFIICYESNSNENQRILL